MEKTRQYGTINLVGYTSENFCGRQLPSKKEILCVYFHHHKFLKKTIRESATCAAEKCMVFWNELGIPTRNKKDIVKQIERLVIKWSKVNKNTVRKNESEAQFFKEIEFKDELGNLFDIAHKDALENLSYDEDKQFLCAQREKGRRGFLAVPIDTSQLTNDETDEEIENTLSTFDSLLDDPKNYILSEGEDYEEVETNNEFSKANKTCSESSDTDKNKIKKIKLMNSDLCINLDRTKMSDRKAARVLAAVLKSLGYDLENVCLSRETIRRNRISLRKNVAESSKANFEVPNIKLIVQWDGKLLPHLNNKHEKIDRLPVLVSSAEIKELLGIPKIEKGTGEAQANAILQLLQEWNLTDEVAGLCFDTTASNSGPSKGTCALLERKLGRDLLYLACRHHIYELPLKAAYEQSMGSTSGPSVLIFKRFLESWPQLNVDNYISGMSDPVVSQELQSEKQLILQFVLRRLKEVQPRGDYKELLELIVIFLGEKSSAKFRFKYPGAYHHARWMAKAIYALKIFLFREEFTLTKSELNGLRDVCIFIVVLYQRPWFTAHKPEAAPNNDLVFLQKLIDCPGLDPKVCHVALKKFTGHLWYLSEELIGLAFFDSNVSLECKRKMLMAIKERDGAEVPSKRLEMDSNNIENIKALTIDQLVTKQSRRLFEKLCITTEFLNFDPETWDSREDYKKAFKIIRGLTVTNDNAERGVALIKEYNSNITYNEDQLQFLLRNVNAHRKNVSGYDKNSLKQSVENYLFHL